MTRISIPKLSLVLLIGASGSGKSSFARRHFLSTEVISSDFCRALVSDDENDQSATKDAFDLLHYIAAKRLAAGRLTVVDATNVKLEDRKSLVKLAREYHVLPSAIVLNLPERVCRERNERRRSWNDRADEHGPFDVIGDVHGCAEELVELLGKLGYEVSEDGSGYAVVPPDGRKAVFLGDLVDRGPDTPGVLRLVMGMVEAGSALCVPGNHDAKLARKLKGGKGKKVSLAHGLAETLAQLEGETSEFRGEVAAFLDGLVGHYVLDGGGLVVAHAGMKEGMQGRASGRCATSRFSARRRGRRTSSGCRCATTGPRSTGAGRRSCTGTPPCRRPSGSTAPST